MPKGKTIGARVTGTAKKLPKVVTEKGTVGRVTPKKTGLFGSATPGVKKGKNKLIPALKKGTNSQSVKAKRVR